MNQPDNFTALALVESLIDNPFYQSVTIDFDQDPVQRRNVLASYFQYSMAEARRTGRCVVGPASAAGAALWSLPRPLDVEIMESAAKKQFIATVLGPRGVENYHRIVEFMSSRIAPVVPKVANVPAQIASIPSQFTMVAAHFASIASNLATIRTQFLL